MRDDQAREVEGNKWFFFLRETRGRGNGTVSKNDGLQMDLVICCCGVLAVHDVLETKEVEVGKNPHNESVC